MRRRNLQRRLLAQGVRWYVMNVRLTDFTIEQFYRVVLFIDSGFTTRRDGSIVTFATLEEAMCSAPS